MKHYAITYYNEMNMGKKSDEVRDVTYTVNSAKTIVSTESKPTSTIATNDTETDGQSSEVNFIKRDQMCW